MQFRHGGLAIDIPDDWMDQSTLLFVAPPSSETLPTTMNVHQQSEAVSVSFVSAADGDPRLLLEQQASQLEQLDPSFQVLEQGPFVCGLGQGWSCIQRLALEGLPVRQLSVACAVGPMIIVATAAASDSRFESVRQQLKGMLQSMAPATP